MKLKLRTVPSRLASGAYILHSGLELWNGDEEQATATHGMAAAAFPFLKGVPPRRFLRLLAAGQIATGAALLAPFVPNALAGTALTGFGGSLVAFYLRAPGLRKPGSVWPSQAGIGVSKDVWLLGIGLGLLADAASERRATTGGAAEGG
ncbi:MULTISPECIES: hypothetical protein [Actinomadura]|uniref:DoxX family membrane protein n=1 Tax=Actinomadura miaoliensis TaxID=430685 RepID=A0ABP7V215_9ACTN